MITSNILDITVYKLHILTCNMIILCYSNIHTALILYLTYNTDSFILMICIIPSVILYIDSKYH